MAIPRVAQEAVRSHLFRLSDLRPLAADIVVASAIGVGSLLLYLPTLAPDIGIEDNPELAAAAYELGVPHPTGYPLYMLLGHAAIRLLPFGRPVYRMNLLGAIAAACAVTAVYAVARLVCQRRGPASVAALLFGSSAVFWNQVVVADVFSLHLGLCAGALWCMLFWDRSGRAAPLRWAAAMYGVGLTHHATAVLLAPALLYMLLTSRHRRAALSDCLRLAALLLGPLLLYAYLPWAALRDPIVNFGDPRTLPRLWDHVTGQRFGHLMGLPSMATITGLVRDCAPYSGPALWLAGLGALDLGIRRPRYLALFAILALASVVHAASYRIPNSTQYVLTVHMYVSVMAGCGIGRLYAWLMGAARYARLDEAQRTTMAALCAVCAVGLVGVMAAAGYPSAVANSKYSPGPAARRALRGLPQDALLIAGGLLYQPILYVHVVEAARRDMVLIVIADLQYRPYLPLIERLRLRGVELVVPGCYRLDPGRIHRDDCLLRAIVTQNMNHRPVCTIGLPLPGLRKAVPDCTWRETSVEGLYCAGPTGERESGKGPQAGRPVATARRAR